jgi:TRAP-type mannitol/chloroaromatic compound transport system substrate-binding protein
LGKPENLTDQARKAATRSLGEKAAANENYRGATALVQAYRKQGLTWWAIAEKLKRGRI